MNPDKAILIQNKLKPILIPLSIVYGSAVNLKEIYLAKSKKISFNKLKVISIGNIVAGGSGKTPTAIAIAEKLRNFGNVCIITNMYPLKDKRTHVVSINGNIFKKPPKIPDEAYMIAKKVPVTVISSKNRIAALEVASSLKIDFAILDDALHLTKLKKDIEICVFDKEKPFDNGFYIPAGMIRNSKKLIRNCLFKICVNKNNTEHQPNIDCLEAKLEIAGIFDSQNRKIDSKNKSAFVFCGIGNPKSFIKTIETIGIKVKGQQFFKDHHMYTKKEIENLKMKKEETGADLLLTTFKDFVKLEDEEVVYLDINLKIEKLNEIIEEILK